MKIIFVVLAMLCASSWAEKARFDNYRVYTITINNEEQFNIMQQVEDMNNGYVFWNDIAMNRDVDIMVPPHKFADFADLVAAINVESKLKVNNVQELIDNEQPAVQPRVLNWTAYGTYAQIYAWLDSMLAAHPNILTNYNIGYSYQGRLIRAVRLSYKSGNPAIFIESHIHAREWITSATATWLLNNLITSSDPAIRDIAENIDWYIIPITNVDGFVYTHTTDRMWRKTRQPHGNCFGADPNRNFGFQWMQGGASNNPCSDTYAGPLPWSEPETANVRDFLRSINNIRVYLSFHAYGQYLLMPYGHTTSPSTNHANMMSIAQSTVSALAQRFGTSYTYGSIATTLYVASGGSSDWAFGGEGVPVSYTFEFRDRGQNGFILPASQIIPNSQEVTDGIVALIRRARELGQM